MTVRMPKPEPPPPEHSKVGVTFFQCKRQKESGTENKPSVVKRLKAGVMPSKHLKYEKRSTTEAYSHSNERYSFW
jgi:hypothetical protein